MPQRPAAFVLLNPAAGGNRGVARWQRTEGAVRAVCEPRVVETDLGGEWRFTVRQEIEAGTRLFIAAGGDGTVSALADELVRARGWIPLDEFTLGAIGLGSSNDFHKPFGPRVGGVPVRIVPSDARRDLCIARYTAPDGATHTRCFVISASLGVVAEANAFFNDGNRSQRWLRGRWTGGAILYAALHTIATWRNLAVRVRAGGHTVPAAVTNLSVSKTPFVSGLFRYDRSVTTDDGLLAIHLCERMSRPQALGALVDLARGRFEGRPGRRHWNTWRVAVAADTPVALELDGEVVRARRATFGVLREQVRLCR
jgi:diacylglycerol kinase (ATP)